MKKPIEIDQVIRRTIEGRGELFAEKSYAAELVARTNAGLLEENPSDLENFLAVDLIESIAGQVGPKAPNMNDSKREKVCKLLLEAFRSGRFKLVAVGAKWMVVRPATEGKEGEVVVCTLESE